MSITFIEGREPYFHSIFFYLFLISDVEESSELFFLFFLESLEDLISLFLWHEVDVKFLLGFWYKVVRCFF